MFDLDHGRMHNQPGLDDYKGSTLPVDSRSPNHQTTVLGSSSRSAHIMSITSWGAAGPTLVCWTLESYRQLGRPAIWCIESYKQLYMNDQALRWVDWENDELDCEIHKLDPPDSLLKLPVFITWQAESCYVLPSLAQPGERIQAATWANLWASSTPRLVTPPARRSTSCLNSLRQDERTRRDSSSRASSAMVCPSEWTSMLRRCSSRRSVR